MKSRSTINKIIGFAFLGLAVGGSLDAKAVELPTTMRITSYCGIVGSDIGFNSNRDYDDRAQCGFKTYGEAATWAANTKTQSDLAGDPLNETETTVVYRTSKIPFETDDYSQASTPAQVVAESRWCAQFAYEDHEYPGSSLSFPYFGRKCGFSTSAKAANWAAKARTEYCTEPTEYCSYYITYKATISSAPYEGQPIIASDRLQPYPSFTASYSRYKNNYTYNCNPPSCDIDAKLTGFTVNADCTSHNTFINNVLALGNFPACTLTTSSGYFLLIN